VISLAFNSFPVPQLGWPTYPTRISTLAVSLA
jgi:hypothetical protein